MFIYRLTDSTSSTTVGPLVSANRLRTPEERSRSRAVWASADVVNSTCTNTSPGSSRLRKSL
jgi:hypothetical protein